MHENSSGVIDAQYDVTTKEKADQHSVNHAALVSTAQSGAEGEFRKAYSAEGTGAVQPDVAVTVLADDIITWLNFINPNAKTLTISVSDSETDVAASTDTKSNRLGWWVTVNAGSPVIALGRLKESFDPTLIAKYVPGATIDADNNDVSFVVGANDTIQITSSTPIADIYVIPVAAQSVGIGNSLLSGVLT